MSETTAGQPLSAASPPPPDAVSISLGYDESNDVVVPHAVVSGRHARIYRVGRRFVIEDQSSTNGTWLDEQRVERATIELGETFALGSVRMEFDDELRRLLVEKAGADGMRSVPFEPGRVLTIGRAPSCDVVVDAPVVSSVHAELTVLGDGSGYRLVDRGSTNGTWLNSRSNPVTTPVTVRADDVVFFGSYRLPLSRLGSLVSETSDPSAVEAVAGAVFVVGRDARSVDIPLDAPVVSARHAEIRVLPDGRFRVRDLGSSNGTFINGVQIRGSTLATVDDRVSLGSFEVRLDPHVGVVRKRYQGDIMLRAERVSIDVPDDTAPSGKKRILDDVSFTVYPTEFVGLMGPSGAGKTTLMMALAGLTPPTEGRSQINGLDVYESFSAFRGNIGYVPQDDIIFPQLTVYESLYFTARLRLPPDTTREDIDRKIDAILQRLEIQHTRNTRIGDALDKGISGGERKRVNLAQELITEPALLFLDEPTSGLASQDTLNVMRLLRELADDGKTIMLTIHQPSLEAYRLMDNVLYLFRGTLVYYGPAYPDSILHFNRDATAGPERDKLLADPGNALRPLAEEQRAAMQGPGAADDRLADIVATRRRAYDVSPYHRQYVADRAGAPLEVAEVGGGAQKTMRRGAWRQWGVLTRRAATIKLKDKVNTAILAIQAPIIGLILWLVFSTGMGADSSYFESLRKGPAALFLLVASAVWFGCSNAAREIVGEQAVYRRERMVNLIIPSYVGSKVAVLGAVCALQCLVLLAIVYLPLRLEGNFLAMYGVLLLTSFVGMGMGLTLSALVRSQEAAVALVPLILIPQIILGGVIMPVHEMKLPTQVLAATTATRWGYEAMLHVEYGDDDLVRLAHECGIPRCVWGTGATGFSFAYYSGDPAQATESRTTAGVESLRGGQIPFVEPRSDALCQAFCSSIQHAEVLTPLDRSFGVDHDDALRRQAIADIALDGHAPDLVTSPQPAARAGLGAALAVLNATFLFFVALVMALLRSRDVDMN